MARFSQAMLPTLLWKSDSSVIARIVESLHADHRVKVARASR